MNKFLTLLLSIILIFSLSACSSNVIGATATDSVLEPTRQNLAETNISNETTQETTTTSEISVDYDSEDLGADHESEITSNISLNGNSISFAGEGISVKDSVTTITSAGAYEISGTLTDGQIIITAGEDDMVELILNGVEIESSFEAAIYIQNAEKVVLIIGDNTENKISSSAPMVNENETEIPNATIYSQSDITIKGNGALQVISENNHGIASKDDLLITGGILTFITGKDGVKGRDLIAIKDGSLTIQAEGDGMQSTNIDETERGNVVIDGGTINIQAGLDGIQAANSLIVNEGNLDIVTGEGSSQNYAGGESKKGLKATNAITINAGTININSMDDAVHSNNTITINGGDILISSGDDGLHSDTTLEINAGNLNILQSYEGIESATITINDGLIHLVSSDDGINAAGGVDGSSMGGRPGQNNFTTGGNYNLYINGGYIAVNAFGDGIDINGSIEMNAGVVIVNGPTENMNGALDYMGTFTINDGFLVAVGSAGMAQAPSTSSTQYSVLYNFSSQLAAGTLVHVESASGEKILTFSPTKNFQSIGFSTANLENGETYQISTGGKTTGNELDGLFTDGVYTSGTQVTNLTISSIVTGSGTMGGFPGGGGGGRPQRP